jgi:uncharacterized protein YeaO (DUF488 family)
MRRSLPVVRRPRVRRVYDPVQPDDGVRVLVDRIWPRGLRKDEAHIDEWCKDVAPSSELRRWYGHSADRLDEFATRYRSELTEPVRAAAHARLAALLRAGPLTLLTATKELDRSHATVLAGDLGKSD